jgi:predicted PolB exonuclease-like 3'-5' exonuclease
MPAAATAYLVFDTESVPDGTLLNYVKYPSETMTPEQAVDQAQAEARRQSAAGSDFLPVTFQYPVAAALVHVAGDFRIQGFECLDAPQFRPQQIVDRFWETIRTLREQHGDGLRIVTFNGRGFDLPLMEMAAFRFGVAGGPNVHTFGKRYEGWHLDLMDWLTNAGDFRLSGGLNLLSKLLGKPGKMEVTGKKVYQLFLQNERTLINDYCLFDTFDTYFVFLRTRVLAGELTLEQERKVVADLKETIARRAANWPTLNDYLANWGDWNPWI